MQKPRGNDMPGGGSQRPGAPTKNIPGDPTEEPPTTKGKKGEPAEVD